MGHYICGIEACMRFWDLDIALWINLFLICRERCMATMMMGAVIAAWDARRIVTTENIVGEIESIVLKMIVADSTYTDLFRWGLSHWSTVRILMRQTIS